MGRKPPFKILGSSNTIVAQKKLIFILVRVIISPVKNPRKPVSILREGVKDFKLLNHIKLLVTDYSYFKVIPGFRVYIFGSYPFPVTQAAEVERGM
jgi:hypothetical protein